MSIGDEGSPARVNHTITLTFLVHACLSMYIAPPATIDDLENNVQQLSMENVWSKEAKKLRNRPKSKLCNRT